MHIFLPEVTRGAVFAPIFKELENFVRELFPGLNFSLPIFYMEDFIIASLLISVPFITVLLTKEGLNAYFKHGLIFSLVLGVLYLILILSEIIPELSIIGFTICLGSAMFFWAGNEIKNLTNST